ncbi:unnamed protein product [Rotaria sordida]|uniref:F-box domain-containing protein n=2 Tax=Rotaria sordida TaxID=392033 RepID=A0A814U288_9BILA|nr:unnamed protein product [Rotaria sordida]CAF3736686.1 unnamed protein product [Rotaria sordida]
MSSCLLDHLPVECLYMIFEYFWAQEIFHSFLNVTQYISQVLYNYNGYLLNFKSIRKKDFDLICRSIKPCQIQSLTLSDSEDTVEQSQLFLSFFSVNQFIHLRALTLINIDRNSISAFSDINKLSCLVSIEIDSNSQISINSIASQLKRIIVNSCSDDYSNHGMLIPSIQLPRLRYLSLERCSFSRLYSILRLASNLISLHVSIICWSSKEMNNLINNDQESPFKLVYLYMTMNLQTYYQTYDWVNAGIILAPFQTSFWIDQERQWFVTFDRQSLSLFTVPRFAPTICSHLSKPILHHTTTLPRDQHGIFYDHITELIIDNTRELKAICEYACFESTLT